MSGDDQWRQRVATATAAGDKAFGARLGKATEVQEKIPDFDRD